MKHFYKLLKKKFNKSCNIIDIGCGVKSLPENFYYNIKNKKLMGLDLDKNSLLASRNFGYFTVCANAESIPFKKHSADFVVLKYILEHAGNPERIITEISTIMKPNTHIYIVVPKWYAFQDMLYRFLGRICEILKKGKQAHIQKFSFKKINRLMLFNSFKLISYYEADAGLSFMDKTASRKFFKKYILIMIKIIELFTFKNLLKNNELHFLYIKNK